MYNYHRYSLILSGINTNQGRCSLLSFGRTRHVLGMASSCAVGAGILDIAARKGVTTMGLAQEKLGWHPIPDKFGLPNVENVSLDRRFRVLYLFSLLDRRCIGTSASSLDVSL